MTQNPKQWSRGGNGAHWHDCWKVHEDCFREAARCFLKDFVLLATDRNVSRHNWHAMIDRAQELLTGSKDE